MKRRKAFVNRNKLYLVRNGGRNSNDLGGKLIVVDSEAMRRNSCCLQSFYNSIFPVQVPFIKYSGIPNLA